MASNLNSKIYVPMYPLAPHHTYQESYELLLDLYQELLKEDKPIILMGDSAGGGLSLSFAEYLKTINLKIPDKLILLSPWVDISIANQEISKFEKKDPLLSSYGLKEIGKIWDSDLNNKDYRVSPIYGDLSGLPKTLLIVGTREIFYPDINLLYKKLQDNNVETKLIIGKGMNHIYPLYPIPEAKEIQIEIKKYINS